jgi:ribosomal protein S13
MFLNISLYINQNTWYRTNKKKYGIGSSLCFLFCKQMGLNPHVHANVIDYTHISDGFKKLLVSKNMKLDLNLQKSHETDLMRHIKLHTYQGYNLRSRLPLRGQRKRTNAQTARKFFNKIFTTKR